ncbi:hypothetical protein ACJX0J_032310, partial [Zea mays]
HLPHAKKCLFLIAVGDGLNATCMLLGLTCVALYNIYSYTDLNNEYEKKILALALVYLWIMNKNNNNITLHNIDPHV